MICIAAAEFLICSAVSCIPVLAIRTRDYESQATENMKYYILLHVASTTKHFCMKNYCSVRNVQRYVYASKRSTETFADHSEPKKIKFLQ